MDYNTNYNNAGTEIQPGTSNKVLMFAITLFIICVVAFAFFYYFYVARPTPIVPTESRALTQEEIDAIIAKEPKTSDEGGLTQAEINAIIKAEGQQTSDEGKLTEEDLLKIKQAN